MSPSCSPRRPASSRKPRHAVGLLAALVVLSACRRSPDAADTGAAPSGGAESDISVVVTPATHVPTVQNVSWTSALVGETYVEYGLDAAYDLRTPNAVGSTISVMGLKAGRDYDARVVIDAGDGTQRVSAAFQLQPPPPAEGLPVIGVYDFDPTRAAGEGAFVTSLIQADKGWVVIIDRDGDYLWWWELNEGQMTPTSRPSVDGKSIIFTQADIDQVDDTGEVVRILLDGSDVIHSRTWGSHHDFVEIPDEGTLAWLSVEVRDDIEWDGSIASVAADTILEGPEGLDVDDATVQRFSYFDYVDPWPACSHTSSEAYGTGAFDWTHSNSLMFDEDDDAFLIMSKNLDSVLKIDRQSGEVLWQLGGEHSDFRPASANAQWTHGHMSHMWDGGLLVFDNGYHSGDEHSRLMELSFDEDDMTFKLEWEYFDPEDRFIAMLGDGRKLEGGTYLGSWTPAGLLSEVTASGDVVWQAQAAVGTAFGRVSWVDDLYDIGRRKH